MENIDTSAIGSPVIQRKKSRRVTHACRTKRRPTGGVVITERDLEILRALRAMKFLRTSQIARLCFGRLTSTVRLRLRKLMDDGLIRAWLTSLNEENVYSLDRRGLALITDAEERWHVPTRLERRLAHLTAINDIRINLTIAAAACGGEIVWWYSDWELKEYGVQGLVPDAVFELRLGAGIRRFLLEVDLGSEPGARILGDKFRRYTVLDEQRGGTTALPLLVTTDVRRLSTLLEIAAREPGATEYVFTTLRSTSPERILGQVWTSARLSFGTSDCRFVSLAELVNGGNGGLP